MHRTALISLATLAAAASLLGGCGGSGGGGGPVNPGGGGSSLNLVRRSLDVTVTPPPGFTTPLSSLSVRTGAGAAPLSGGGTAQAQLFEPGMQLAQVLTTDNKIVMMGWLDNGRAVINSRTTAEALLYFDLGAYSLPSAARVKVAEELSTRTEVQPLADAINAALATDPLAVQKGTGGIDQARKTAVTQIMGGAPAAAGRKSRGMQIDPSNGKSGITVQQDGLNALTIRNDYRRRAIAFVERVSYKATPESPETPSPAAITRLDISPTSGATSILGSISDVITGNVPYAPVTTEPLTLSLQPTDAYSTKYRVVVVGIGLRAGDVANLTTEQRNALLGVAAKTVIQDFALPLIVNTLLPIRGNAIDSALTMGHASDVVQDFISIMGSTVPGIWEKAADGDLSGALTDVFETLRNSNTARVLVFEGIFRMFQSQLTLDQQFDFVDRGNHLLDVMEGIDAAMTLVDSTVQFAHAVASGRAEGWDITVNKSRVRLSPVRADISRTERAEFEATLPDGGTGGSAPVLAYRWSTNGHHGSLRDTAGHSGTSFDSSQAKVTYVPSGSSEGADTVTVEVFEVQGSQRQSLGTASSTVTVRNAVPRIVPERTSLKSGETQTFTARVDSELQDGGRLSYRWFTAGRFGRFTSGGTEASSGSASATYTVTGQAPGEETVAVEVFSTKDGERRSLGIARANVKIEEKKSIVFGRYFTQINPIEDNRKETLAIVAFPKVEGAKRYSIRAYDFNDYAYYGRQYSASWTPPNVPSGWHDKGAEVWIPISGTWGPGDSADYMNGRFAGMIVEVTVTY
jgi:hypothetical protein